jgi:peroxiredoxin Q/BCP
MLQLDWLWSDPLAVGTTAPPFTLKDHEGREVNLLKLRGKNVILVFYPADDTPG